MFSYEKNVMKSPGFYEKESPEKKMQWIGVIDDYVDLCDPEDTLAVFEVSDENVPPEREGMWECLKQWDCKTRLAFSAVQLVQMLQKLPNCCR